MTQHPDPEAPILECYGEETGKAFATINNARDSVEIDWEVVTQMALEIQAWPRERLINFPEAVALLLYLVKNQHQN